MSFIRFWHVCTFIDVDLFTAYICHCLDLGCLCFIFTVSCVDIDLMLIFIFNTPRVLLVRLGSWSEMWNMAFIDTHCFHHLCSVSILVLLCLLPLCSSLMLLVELCCLQHYLGRIDLLVTPFMAYWCIPLTEELDVGPIALPPNDTSMQLLLWISRWGGL